MTDDGQAERWQPLRRLATVQDSGNALIGPNRIDIFWDTGALLSFAAQLPSYERPLACMENANNLDFVILDTVRDNVWVSFYHEFPCAEYPAGLSHIRRVREGGDTFSNVDVKF
jgi:hypothetical protein